MNGWNNKKNTPIIPRTNSQEEKKEEKGEKKARNVGRSGEVVVLNRAVQVRAVQGMAVKEKAGSGARVLHREGVERQMNSRRAAKKKTKKKAQEQKQEDAEEEAEEEVFAVYLLSDPNGPPTAFLLFRPQCTVGVLAGTHWGALRCPGRMASGTQRQPLSAALLHCCCTAEPVLTRATNTPLRSSTRVVGFGRLG